MPYQGYRKEDEKENNAPQQQSEQKVQDKNINSVANGDTENENIPTREDNKRFEAQKRINDENVRQEWGKQPTNDPGVQANLYNMQKQDEYYRNQGDYQKSREYADAYINQLQSYIQGKEDQKYKDMGLKSGDYQREDFEKQAQQAIDQNNFMKQIIAAYKRQNMPVRQKNIEEGGYGVEKRPYDDGGQGIVGGEAPWSPIDYAYEQTPSGGYNQIAYGDEFGDPFNAQHYPYVANNLANPLSTLPEYISNYIVPGMDHFPTQEEIEQLYDTSIW